MKKTLYFLSIIFILLLSVLILKNPNLCIESTAYGLNLCACVLIPSLYPFTFCVLFVINSGVLKRLSLFDGFAKRFFGMDIILFSVFLLSLVGGYPLGAKLINEIGPQKQTAKTMLNYCVNAGPAFIITAVGNGIFGSQKIGLLLFVSHIIPSFLLAFFFRKKIIIEKETPIKQMSVSDNFVISATSAASTLINISAFVLLFSVITAYCNTYDILKPISALLEVTNAISRTDNILLISAIMGFAGISVWCQVYALSKTVKPNILHFLFCRIFHALTSAFITYIGIKIFDITLPTLSNGKIFTFSAFTDTAAVGFSLIALSILFIISTMQKNFAGNILQDIV